jgi:hypothetical protein
MGDRARPQTLVLDDVVIPIVNIFVAASEILVSWRGGRVISPLSTPFKLPRPRAVLGPVPAPPAGSPCQAHADAGSLRAPWHRAAGQSRNVVKLHALGSLQDRLPPDDSQCTVFLIRPLEVRPLPLAHTSAPRSLDLGACPAGGGEDGQHHSQGHRARIRRHLLPAHDIRRTTAAQGCAAFASATFCARPGPPPTVL